MRDVVRAHPEHVGLVVPVASYLMHDDSPHVKKVGRVGFVVLLSPDPSFVLSTLARFCSGAFRPFFVAGKGKE